jgi:hypothetical protein
VRSRSKPEDKNASVGIAEPGHGFAPVLAIAIGATPLASNLFAILHEARTTGAGNDLGVKFDEPVAIH